MIFNYIKIGFRSAARNKLFTIVNVIGLSLGLAIAFIVLVHVRRELSYEKHIPDYELIYRAGSTEWAKVPPMLAGRLKGDFAEVRHVARLFALDEPILSYGEALAFPKYVYLVDSTINDVFRFVFERGDPATALRDPSSIVLSHSMASALFKDGDDPIGKTIKINGHSDATVVGVIKDFPPTTHLKIDIMFPLHAWTVGENESRSWMAMSTFIRFDTEAEVRKVASNMQAFEYRFYSDVPKEEIDRRTDHFELQPIADIHLESHREKETEANNDLTYIYIFSVFGVLILFIASINFINLFTAQAMRRLKEVGIRKAIGARKGQLISQFLLEALVMVACTGVFAFAIVCSTLPMYNEIAPVDITISQLVAIENLIVIAAILFATGVLSGGYPAYVIASNHTINIFRGKTQIGGAATIRNVLVSIQFIVSLFLLMATAVLWSQINYMHNAKLGLNKDHVVAVKLYSSLWLAANRHKDVMREELLKTGLVSEISVVDRLVGERFGIEHLKANSWIDDVSVPTRNLMADEYFLQTMEIELLQGSNFNPNDTVPQFIVNETAANMFRARGTTDIIGTEVSNIAQRNQVGRIVGVVRDFNYASLHSAVDPVAITFVSSNGLLLVRLSGDNLQGALVAVETTLKRLAPGTAMIYTFIDDKLQSLYAKEYGLYHTARVFSILTVIIASLGLFALAANTAETRKREIGIRKVMGASVHRIVGMLCADYMKLIVVALTVTVPGALYVGMAWLTGFSYRTAIQWWMFAVPAVIVIVLALVAVIGHSLRVAMTNPAHTLKHD